MKTLLYLLFPLFLFAQNPSYPDTVFMKSGKMYPCHISSLNESKVEIKYEKNSSASSGIIGIEKIILENYGTVYLAAKGFLIDVNSIQNYLSKRGSAQEQGKEVKPEFIQKENKPGNNLQEQNKWSFGVFYIPFNSLKIFQFYEAHYYYDESYIYSYENNISMMEGQFSYLLITKLRLTFDISYTTSYNKDRYEEHTRYSDRDDKYDNGNVETTDMKLVNFQIGLKYYFTNLTNQHVSAYILAGAGKQFAFVTEKYKKLFVEDPPQYTIEDNNDEFLERLNSPVHFNFGFGAEYAFNESLSLFSNIRFYYSKISATYDYRRIYDDRTYTRLREFKNSEIITRIGLGLNFYF